MIKKNDKVWIIAGGFKDKNISDKGEGHLVIKVFPKKNFVHLEGVNQIRHKKAKKEGETSGRVEIPFPIHVSNLKLINSKKIVKEKK
jgi:large subunit ribosomal protein L24